MIPEDHWRESTKASWASTARYFFQYALTTKSNSSCCRLNSKNHNVFFENVIIQVLDRGGKSEASFASNDDLLSDEEVLREARFLNT